MVKAIWAVACSVAVVTVVAGTLMMAGPVWMVGTAKAESILLAPGMNPASRQGGSPAMSTKEEPPVVLSGPAYRVGPEDVLRVSVWDNKELTMDVVVRPDGKISMPLVQDVQAEGLTASELADLLHAKLQLFIKDPQVSVIVTQINAPKVFVIGSVTRPGPYPLRSEMSVLQALSLAGGFTPFASLRNIKVVRNIKGTQEVRKVNYYDMIDGGEGNYLLKPGDTIVVP